MNQFLFLHVRGFAAPFAADERCRGTIVDAAGKMVPILVLPSVESSACRFALAQAIAANLNREWRQHEAARPGAAA